MKKILFILLLLCCMTSMKAQESRTAYNFLRLPVSAHAAALGGENITIIEDDPSLMFSNPALLQSVSSRTISLNYMNYMKGANTASASYNWTVKEKATVAVSAQYMDYGKMKEVTADNVQTGEFSAKDIAVGAYLGYDLAKHLAGGIAAKFITSYIGDYNSIAMCVDLGLNYYDPDTEWSVSAVAKNLGGQLKAYDDDFERMPFDLRLGVSKRLQGAPFRLSATLTDLTHWDYKFANHVSAGIEVLLSQTMWIGAGYNFRRADEMGIKSNDTESAHGAGLSFGAGIQLERFKLNVAYGKYHVSSASILVNAAYTL
jgi:hypothetical protein